jgi:predicted kinase
MSATDRPASVASSESLYSTAMTRQTYARLASLARGLLAAGTSVVVDATCSRAWQRDQIATVAREASAPLVWLDIDLPLDLLLERVAARSASGEDPSDATPDTVRTQLAAREPIGPAECAAVSGCPAPIHVRFGAGELAAPSPILGALAARLASLPGMEHPR